MDDKAIASTPNMNYENYEKAIVEHYGVELQNFPDSKVIQPGKPSRPLL